jgi:hypothetical protein
MPTPQQLHNRLAPPCWLRAGQDSRDCPVGTAGHRSDGKLDVGDLPWETLLSAQIAGCRASESGGSYQDAWHSIVDPAVAELNRRAGRRDALGGLREHAMDVARGGEPDDTAIASMRTAIKAHPMHDKIKAALGAKGVDLDEMTDEQVCGSYLGSHHFNDPDTKQLLAELSDDDDGICDSDCRHTPDDDPWFARQGNNMTTDCNCAKCATGRADDTSDAAARARLRRDSRDQLNQPGKYRRHGANAPAPAKRSAPPSSTPVLPPGMRDTLTRSK